MSKPVITGIKGTIAWSDGTKSTYALFQTVGRWGWAQDGLDPHVLGERDSGDLLDKLSEAVAEHVAERTPTTHWHVGNNIVGRSPEGETACFDNDEEARERLDEELSLAQDGLPDCAEPFVAEVDGRSEGDPCGECEPCEAHDQLSEYRDTIKRSGVTDGGEWPFNDGHGRDVTHWVHVVPAADCDIEQD